MHALERHWDGTRHVDALGHALGQALGQALGHALGHALSLI